MSMNNFYSDTIKEELIKHYANETRLEEQLRLEALLREKYFIQVKFLENHTKIIQTAGRIRRKKIIVMPPGYIFSNIGKVIFTKKSYERVVEPAITMMQEEYFETYSQKRYLMARWIKIRFFSSFCKFC